MKIFKIKAEEYKSMLDLALNREETSQRSHRKNAPLNTPSLTMYNSPLNNNTDFFRDNMYEVNLTVEDLIEDKSVFLEIIKKEQKSKVNLGRMRSVIQLRISRRVYIMS